MLKAPFLFLFSLYLPSLGSLSFVFCLIILAFSLTKTMAAHYFLPFPVCRPNGLSGSDPNTPRKNTPPAQKGAPEMTKEIAPQTRRRKENAHTPHLFRQTKGKQNGPNARSLWVTTLQAPPPPPPLSIPRRRHRPFLLFRIAIPAFLHWRRSPSHVGGPQEVEHRRAAPLIRQKVPHTPPPRLLLDPCP